MKLSGTTGKRLEQTKQTKGMSYRSDVELDKKDF